TAASRSRSNDRTGIGRARLELSRKRHASPKTMISSPPPRWLRVEGKPSAQGSGNRDRSLDLQRHGVDWTQAPRGRPLEQRTDPVRESVPRGPRGPPAPLRRGRPVPPRGASRPERGESGRSRGAGKSARTEHARAVPLPRAAPLRDEARPHLCIPERPGGFHPELVLPRWGARDRQTPGAVDRRYGLREDPARSDALGPVDADAPRAQSVSEGPLTSARELLVVLSGLDFFRELFRGFPFDRDAHRDARAH